MPFNDEIARALVEGEPLTPDFSTMAPADAADLIDTANAVMPELGAHLVNLRDSVAEGNIVESPTIDTWKVPLADSRMGGYHRTPGVQFDVLNRRMGEDLRGVPVIGPAYGAAIDNLVTPAVQGLQSAGANVAQSIHTMFPPDVGQPPAPPPTATEIPPELLQPNGPVLPMAGQGAMDSSGAMPPPGPINVEAGAPPEAPHNPIADMMATGAEAAYTIPADIAKFTATPLGLATLSGGEIAPMVERAGNAARALRIPGAASMLEGAGALETVPSAFTAAARLTGKSLSTVAGIGSEGAMQALTAVSPRAAASLTEWAGYFGNYGSPESIRTIHLKAIETANLNEFAKGLLENMTPPEAEQLGLSFQVTMAEQRTALETMKRAAETVMESAPPSQLDMFASGILNKITPEQAATMAESPEALRAILAAGRAMQPTAEALRVRNMTLAQYATTIPEDIRTVIAKEARRKGTELIPADMVGIRDEILNRFSNLADRQIAAGVAKPEAFAVYEGNYVPIAYIQHEIPLVDFGPSFNMSETGARPGFDWSRLKPREITDPVAQLESGAITDPRYAIYKGLMQETHNAIGGEYLQALARNPKLAAKAAHEAQMGSVSTYLSGLAADPNVATPLGIRPGWQMVHGREWGALNGMYVHPGLIQRLTPLYQARNKMVKLIHGAASVWKAAVTVWNPAVHAGNTVANQFLIWGAGVRDPGDYARAVRSYISKDGAYRDIVKTALIGSPEGRTAVHEGLARTMLESYAKHSGEPEYASIEYFNRVVAQAPQTWGRELASYPGRAYQAEEELGKYIIAHVAYTKGIPFKGVAKGDLLGAAEHAEKWLFNYSDISPAVRDARSGMGALLATPFVTFQVKAAPRMVETFMESPEIFARFQASLEGWNRAAMHNIGLTDEDFKAWKRMRADQSGTGFMRDFQEMAPVIVLPVRDSQGSPMAVDLARFTPWGQIFQPRGSALPISGPLFTAGFQYSGGQRLWGGSPIFEPKAEGASPALASQLSPSIAAKRNMAGLDPFIPPLAKRATIGALSAAGPKWGTVKPNNNAAYLLDLLGSPGAVTPEGTRTGPLRQLVAALLASPVSVKKSALKQNLDLNRYGADQAAMTEIRRRALGHARANKAANKP